MDIPSIRKDAATDTNINTNTDQTTYEYQKAECVKALNALPKDKASTNVTFNSLVCQQVVTELEQKGYVVKYTTSYSSSDKKITSYVKITNPEVKDSLGELFECFDSSNQYNNAEMNDKMKNLFVKFLNIN